MRTEKKKAAHERRLVAALYTRVSTREQASEGYSIGEQEERLKKFAASQNWIIGRVYCDGGFSGGSLDRPAIKEMIDDAISHKFDVVAVYKLDRLSRSQKDTLYLIEDVFNEHEIGFKSMTEPFDTTTPFGRAMIGSLSIFAQLEREQIKERMSIGREGRAKAGLFHGGSRIPIGYRYKDGHLLVDPYEASVVRWMYEEYVSGRSMNSIHQEIRERQISTSYGSIAYSTLENILSNSTYTGVVKHNGQEFPGIHEPIIERDLYERAQRRRLENENRIRGYNFTRRSSILTGSLYCAECGSRVKIYQGPARQGVKNRYLCCIANKCKIHMRLDAAENAVIDQISRLSLDSAFFDAVATDDHEDRSQEEREALTGKIKMNRGKISRLMDLYAMSAIDMTELGEKIAALNQEIDSCTARIAALDAAPVDRSREEIISLAATLSDLIEAQDTERIRFVVKSLIDRVEIAPEHTIRIHWSF